MTRIYPKTIFIVLFATFAAMAVASTTMLAVVWNKVCEFDRRNGCDVLAGKMRVAAVLPTEKPAQTNVPAAAVAKMSVPVRVTPFKEKLAKAHSDRAGTGTMTPVAEPSVKKSVSVRSIKFPYCDDDKGAVEIVFTEMPKLDDLRRSIVITPKVEGVSIDAQSTKNWREDTIDYVVRLESKAFKFRQEYTVVVKKDLQFDDECELDGGYSEIVKRPDLMPSVSLTHVGRYLPVEGDHALMVDYVNVGKIRCETRYVLPENIVQLLAREEAQYTKSLGWFSPSISADSEATEELSTLPHQWDETVVQKPNERRQHPIFLRAERGVVAKGVYLLAVGQDRPKKGKAAEAEQGDEDDDEDAGYSEYRLVCVSDIGLSARQDSQGLRVWATSLSSGKPLPNLSVKLYAANRLILAEKWTDQNGESVLGGWDARYKPFALVVSQRDRSDFSFMAIRNSMEIDEPLPIGERPKYLKEDQCKAFVWTERGIYRHGEKIMTHVILRNGKGNAPKPFPVIVRLEDVKEKEVASVSAVCDEYGAVKVDSFFAPDNLPSGKWKIKVLLPGKDGILLGEREVKIEEFVPPQVRVKLKNLPAPNVDVTNIVYKVAAEHLFGGPAKKITAESLVAFTDAEFAPEGWKGYRFGNEKLGLQPNYTRLDAVFTDDNGEASFAARMYPSWGEPKAAVRMIIQGSVFETGGRPAVTRESCVIHKYPHYLGSNIPRYIRQKRGYETFSIVQVNPDGTSCKTARKLRAKLWKLEYVYNLVKEGSGANEYRWDSQQVRRPVEMDEEVLVGKDGTGSIKLPVSGSGDYELVVKDEELGVSHGTSFWISAFADDEARAALNNPTAVSISADKALYREGERPRLTLKCPFRGYAWLSVMRDKTLYTRVMEVTNLTRVVELDPVDGAWAPDVDVAVSLVQAVKPGQGHLASRAHGIASLRIRTRDSELPVKIVSSVKCSDQGGSEVRVQVAAKGEASVGERAVVTVVDEGINILTNEKIPNPIGHLSIERGGWHPLYDMYGRLLPLLDAGLKAGGVKTGGDDLAGLMNRVSPVPTRRFKPLSQWKFDVVLTNGVGETLFKLPEFVGEVRITALVYNRRGTGCDAVHQKVTPKLVMSPDAPRFAAPGDRFSLTLSLFNRSGKAGSGEIEYEIVSDGVVELLDAAKGKVSVADGDSKVLNFSAAAKAMGQGVITYRTKGLGETHVSKIELPVRSAVPWEERAEVVVLRPGETHVSTNAAGSAFTAPFTRRSLAVSGSPIAELRAAYDYLSEYPHGCLEQTTSRVFPLLYGLGKKKNTLGVAKAGVSRVVSMLRETDFTMWPDCNCPPWDREVSLYAAHFLIEAGTLSELKVDAGVTKQVCALLKRWAYDADTNISVYACHTLALAGCPEKDRMYALYDLRDRLPLLSRARLARAFVRVGDPKRARALVTDAVLDPKDVREAAFALLTVLEMNSRDSRLGKLVLFLQKKRDRQRFHWGTTGDNAHALLALGAYYRTSGIREGAVDVLVKDGTAESRLAAGTKKVCNGGAEIAVNNCGKGDAYLSLKQLSLPEANQVTNRHNVIRVSRRFKNCEGFDVDMANLVRGELLIGEITLSADKDCSFSDLVVEELLPACLEPDRKEVADVYARCHGKGDTSWQLRSDIRDDRVIVFSKPFSISAGETGDETRVVFYYAVRVITPGEFVMPGTSVEAMYAPEINARLAPGRICVKP